MSGVYEEFEAQLAGWRRRYARHRHREILRLCLLALEREQIVSVAYREELIAGRVASMPLPEEARDLVRQALTWTWKDEEMHAVFIRGALLGLGSLRHRARVYLRQLAGTLGGWAGSVQQHVRWREAPLSRVLATLLMWAGLLLGKVPRTVRRQLRYGSFRDFCSYNVEAERTASLCWGRLADLVGSAREPTPFLDREVVLRVRDDEDRHARVFAILTAMLDGQDRMAPGASIDEVAAQIAAVGEFFLARARRRSLMVDNPLGSGGPVQVLQGEPGIDRRALFLRLLVESGLAGRIEERARALRKPVVDLRVAVKPTFMFGYARTDLCPITDPTLLDELGRYVRRELGCREVAVVEGPTIYDRFYRNRSVHEVARYFGVASPHFTVVDLSCDRVPHSFARGLGQASVSRTWKEADVRVSFGKMRSNPVDMATLCIANLEGLGAPGEDFFFAERRADRETAIMMLLDAFPPHFAILDAYDPVADGVAGMMGSTRPVAPRRFYAGADALSVDIVAGRHTGIDPRKSGVLRAACHWFGDPTGRIAVRGADGPIEGWRGPFHSEFSAFLSLLAYPVYQFASARGALFVPEMDEAAFPPLAREPLWLRAGRRMVRSLLGLHHAR